MATCPNCEGFGKKVVETASGTALFKCVSCYGTGEVGRGGLLLKGQDPGLALPARVETGTYKTGFTGTKITCEACGGKGLV